MDNTTLTTTFTFRLKHYMDNTILTMLLFTFRLKHPALCRKITTTLVVGPRNSPCTNTYLKERLLLKLSVLKDTNEFSA